MKRIGEANRRLKIKQMEKAKCTSVTRNYQLKMMMLKEFVMLNRLI